jgi:hypothetical protein
LIRRPAHSTLHRELMLDEDGCAHVSWAVLKLFNGPRPFGALACHKDDDRENNHVDNLYWGTPTSNMEDQTRNGNAFNGQHSQVDDELASQMTAAYESGLTVMHVAEAFGLSYSVTHHVLSSRTVLRKKGTRSC